MKFLPLFALATAFPSFAQPPEPTGRISGPQLVEQWVTPPDKTKSDLTPAQIYAQRYADGYLAGVADATQGKAWCDTRTVKMHEIDAYVVWAMKELPPDQLKAGSAATHIVELLAKKFPCHRKEGK